MTELQELRNKIKIMKDEEGKVNSENTEIMNKEKKKEYKIINIRKNTGGVTRNIENQYKNEIEKLENEKYMLLSSGTYTENDPLIIKIEKKIKRLYESGSN
jgi:hypothetical protein